MKKFLPYPLYAIQQKINNENSFIGKYYFQIDLFNSFIKYILLSVVSLSDKKIKLKNNESDIENLKIIVSKIANNKLSFKISELLELKDVWDDIQKFEKLKNKEIIKDFNIDIYYKDEYKKLKLLIDNIFKRTTFLSKYELIEPYQKENSSFTFLSLSNTLKLKKIKLNKNININLNSIYIRFGKNFFELNTSSFTKNFISKETDIFNIQFENIFNSFINFITGSDYIKLSFNITSKKSKYDIFENYIVERPQVNSFINKFFETKKSGYLFIIGCYGSGKTTIINNYIKNNSDKNFYITNITKNKNYYQNLTQIIKSVNKNFNCDNKSMILKSFLKVFESLDKTKKNILIFEDVNLITHLNEFISIFPEELFQNIYIIFTMSARESITIPKLKDSELYYLPVFSSHDAENLYKLILNQKEIYSEKVFDIVKTTYGIPLYTKIEFFKSLDIDLFEYDKKIKSLKFNFKEDLNDIISYTTKNFPDFKDKIKTFIGLIAISGEGLTKIELKSLLNLPFDLSESIVDRMGAFLIKINGKYKLSNYIFEKFVINELFNNDELKSLHSLMISLLEPWDKKVSSNSLKFLPTHYLNANKIEELKLLLQSNFIRSKFKIYPNEVLQDLKDLIGLLLSQEKKNISELIKFSFIYQKLKEEHKKELSNIFDLCSTKKQSYLLNKVDNLNKNIEKFYQLLLIVLILSERVDRKELAPIIIKLIQLSHSITYDKNNSELIFKISSDIALNGVFDTVHLPRSKEDGVSFIKNIKESPYTLSFAETMLKLIEVIPNELDKSVMLEALINKIAEFRNLELINTFFSQVILSIDKIEDVYSRDRLYYTYISSILKYPYLYNKFMPILMERKAKLENTLFKFSFYANLSLLFLFLKQDNISKSYILEGIKLIHDIDSIQYQNFAFISLIAGINYFEKSSFYDEIIESYFKLISDLSFNYDKVERSLKLIAKIPNYSKRKLILKELLSEISRIYDKDIIPLVKLYIKEFVGIKDKRIINPIISKIFKLKENRNLVTNISLLSIISLNFNEDKYFEMLVSTLDENSTDNAYEIYSTVVEHLETYIDSPKFYQLVNEILKNLQKIHNEDDFTDIYLKILSIFGRKNNNLDGLNIIDYIIAQIINISSTKNSIKVLIQLSSTLMNINQKHKSLNFIHKVFGMLVKEPELEKVEHIKNILEISNEVKVVDNKIYYLSDLLVNIFHFLGYIKNENNLISIIESIFLTLEDKASYFTDLKSVFYKSLEIADKISNAKNKNKLINIIRGYLYLINEKNYLIDLLQKSILISESSFAQSDIKLLTLLTIASLNDKSNNSNEAERIIRTVMAELKFIHWDEYAVDVTTYMINIISSLKDKTKSIELIKSLVKDNYFEEDFSINKVYSEVISNIVKNYSKELVEPLLESLYEKSFKISNEEIKTDYIIKLISYSSSMGKKTIFYKLFDILEKDIDLLLKEENKFNLFKAILIAITKIDPKNLVFIEKLKDKISTFQSNEIKIELSSILASIFMREGKYKESELLFEKSLEDVEKNKDLKKSIESFSTLLLRLINTHRYDSANKILQHIKQKIKLVLDENERFILVARIINKFAQVNPNKEVLDIMSFLFEDITVFSLKNKIKILNMIGKTYKTLKQDELAIKNFSQAEIKLYDIKKIEDKIESMIDASMTVLSAKEYTIGNRILNDLIKIIYSDQIKEKDAYLIKLFNFVFNLGQSKVDPKIFLDLSKQIDNININNLSENVKYQLAYAYAYKNNVDKFAEVLEKIQDNSLKEVLLKFFIKRLKEIEDFDSLVSLSKYLLDNSRLNDFLVSSYLSLVTDKELIRKITDTLISS